MKYISLVLLTWVPLISCAQSKPSNGNSYPLDSAYIRQHELPQRLKQIDKSGENIVKLHLIGFSTNEEHAIHALEIGSTHAKRNVLLIGQHHGDEVLGVETVMAFAEYLTENHKSNSRVKAILDQFRFWIIPTINPEAYRVVSSGEYPWKRKNNSDTNKNRKFEIRTDGVDLNRNYPVFWADDIITQQESPYFKGFAPMSETEIIAVMQLAEKVDFEFAIFYHSSATGAYSEKIYLPWYNPAVEEEKNLHDDAQQAAELYAVHVPKDYEKGTYEVHTGYNSRVGNARNYFFHTHQTKAWLVEIGGINRFGISVIHPKAKVMKQNVKKHVAALEIMFYEYLD